MPVFPNGIWQCEGTGMIRYIAACLPSQSICVKTFQCLKRYVCTSIRACMLTFALQEVSVGFLKAWTRVGEPLGLSPNLKASAQRCGSIYNLLNVFFFSFPILNLFLKLFLTDLRLGPWLFVLPSSPAH